MKPLVSSEFSKKVWFLILSVLGLVVAWQLRSIIAIFFVAFLAVQTMRPFMHWAESKGIHRYIVVPAAIILFLAMVALLMFFIIPRLISSAEPLAQQVAKNLDTFLKTYSIPFSTEKITAIIEQRFASVSVVVFSVAELALRAVAAVVTSVVIAVYWLVDYERVRRGIISIFPKGWQGEARTIYKSIERKLSHWAIGQFLLSLAVGIMVYITLLLLGVDYALELGVIAAVFELLPIIGPVLSAVPAIALAYTQSTSLALLVILAYVLIQQLENHILSPLLFARAVKLHPLIVILSFLVGSVSFGIVGAILAVPTALSISAVVDSLRRQQPAT